MKKYIIIMLLSLVSVGSYSQKTNDTDFAYPIKPGDGKWEKINSVENRIASLQIPESVISKISTERLLDICLEYPYLLDVLFYDDFQKGLEALRNEFNGFNELLNRKDVGKFVLDKDKKFPNQLHKLHDKTEIEKGNFSFQSFVLELILAQECVFATLNNDEDDELLDITINNIDLKTKHTDIFGNLNLIPSYLLFAKKVLIDSDYKFTDENQKNELIEFVNKPSAIKNNIIECLDRYIKNKKQNRIL